MPSLLPTVYVETTVISYLVAHPSRDLLVETHQRVTAEWWQGAPERFTLVVSALVIDEIARGDRAMAAARGALVAGLRSLEVTPEATALASELQRAGSLPPRSNADALHVALAALGGVDYLTTWNLRHLAGAVVRRRIERALRARGIEPPTICTPEELLPTLPSAGDSDA